MTLSSEVYDSWSCRGAQTSQHFCAGRAQNGPVWTTRDEAWLADASDDALVRAARLGDADAFAMIVDRHGPTVFRFAAQLLGGENDAADVVQEAFLSAWKAIASFRGESSLRTWLFTLTARRAADLQRRRRPVPVEDTALAALVPPSTADPLRDIVDAELVAALRQALAGLPWHQRATWLLREVEGLSYVEIASALSLTPGSVRGHLHRGRMMLAERMAPWR